MDEGDWMWFDVGFGPEECRVKGVQRGNVLVEVPCDGPRMLARSDLHESREAAEAAPEASFQ